MSGGSAKPEPVSVRGESYARWQGRRWRPITPPPTLLPARRLPPPGHPSNQPGKHPMKAAYYTSFGEPFGLETVADPTPEPHGVVIEVRATGLCRSDWHGWMGHDPDIRLPHVPGHEFAGIVVAVGDQVRRWRGGERVTLPFVCACGRCPVCSSGNHQVCPDQTQPGFSNWGAFAPLVAVDRADVNLVALPDDISFTTAASLGCRFATAFRAVIDQGRARAGEWVAVHGCGGVGLSAVMVAAAAGARVVAVDISTEALALAREAGASEVVDGGSRDVVPEILERTEGGAQLSLDALGSPVTAWNSVACLGIRGRHVQVGLLPSGAAGTPLPMDRVIARELELLGSHGMQAYRYPEMMALISAGRLRPDRLVTRRISLDEAPAALMAMSEGFQPGVTVITMPPPQNTLPGDVPRG